MPRPLRIHVPDGFYHVILRGNHKQSIFTTSHDRDHWETILAETLIQFGANIHAYCWMTNHVHMVVQIGSAPLGRIMHRAASNYSRWFQRHIPTTGHLFERRHRAILITADAYLLALVRYIHQNPLRAGLARNIADYPWSSHNHYLGYATNTWLTSKRILELLHSDETMARHRYRDFMAEMPVVPPQHESSEPFERSVSVGVKNSGKARPLSSEPISLALLVEQVAAQHGLPLDILYSPTRARAVVRARAIVARRAMAAGIATLSEVADLFGRSTSAMSQALDTVRRSDLSQHVSRQDADQIT